MAKILRIRAREDIIMRMYEANKLLLQQPAVLRVGTAGHFLPGGFFAKHPRAVSRAISSAQPHAGEKSERRFPGQGWNQPECGRGSLVRFRKLLRDPGRCGCPWL